MKTFLKQLKIDDLKPKEKILCIEDDEAIEKGMKVLFSNNISSAPVYHTEKDKKVIIGLVDLIDVVVYISETLGGAKQVLSWLVQEFGASSLITKEDTQECEDLLKDLKDLTPEAEQLLQSGVTLGQFVKEISKYSQRNAYLPSKTGTTVLEIAEKLVKIRRVPILDDKGWIKNYVTQSDMLKTFKENQDKMKDLLAKKVGDFEDEIGTKKIISIKETDQALGAFKLITDHLVSSIPVVNEKGSIVGNISAKDVRLIDDTGELVDRIFLNCREYIKKVKESYDIPVDAGIVKKDSTIGEVIDKLTKYLIHRVYLVTDDNQVPLAVISLRDVIKLVLEKSN